MRIKSYFASSVQAAIGMARREFGDDVTLVTSHASALESRHLGEYEVVFAIDDVPAPAVAEEDQEEIVEDEPAPLLAAAAAASAPRPYAATSFAPAKPAFQTVYEQAVAKPVSVEQGIAEKLDHLRTTFMEMGIEPVMVRALLLMVERSLPIASPVGSFTSGFDSMEDETAVEEQPIAPEASKFTPAEMEFFLSVSGVSS